MNWPKSVLGIAYRTLEHPGAGGMETHFEQVMVALAQRGVRTAVLTSTHPEGMEETDQGGVRKIFLPGTPIGRLNTEWFAKSAAAAQRLFAEEPFDAVAAEVTSGWHVFQLPQRPPAVMFMHGLWKDHIANQWNELSGWKSYLKFPLVKVPEAIYYSYVERDCARRAERVITTATYLSRGLERLYGVSPDRITLNYNRIDDRLFCPRPELRLKTRTRLGFRDSDIVLLIYAVVSKQKGVHIGVDAFAAALRSRPELQLIVAGDGPYLPQVKELAARRGLLERIRWTGRISQEDSVSFYNAADIFVMPTLRIEGMSYIQLEAMSCALPVIISPQGGSEEAQGGTGVLVRPGRVQELAAAIEGLAGAPQRRQALGTAARKRIAERFSWGNGDDYIRACFEGLEPA